MHAALAGAAALLGTFAPPAAGSGMCQRITPGEPMDGNGCGPADSAVGDACNTADDCFFRGCRCEQDLPQPDGTAMYGGATCDAMAPFCVDPSAQYHFEFSSSNDQETWSSSDDFGCLMAHPGEQWLYLTIQRAGVFAMATSSQRDHDYAVWGPFASLEAAQRSCGTLPSPADCGYSSSATEHLLLPNVQAGEVYIVLLTNFARVTQALSAELEAANTAVLSCAAVAKEQQEASAPIGPPPPPPCANLDEINLNCPVHGVARLVPDTCDDTAGKHCREVFTAWFDRCWAAKDVDTMLGSISGARDQLTGFYQLCTGGARAPPPPDMCGDLTSRAAVMNRECCDEPWEDCSSGLPAVCNAGCASVLLPFFADCSGSLGAAAATYQSVVAQCQHPVSPPPPRPPPPPPPPPAPAPEPAPDPCGATPCANGGACTVVAGGSGHRRAQTAAAAFTCSCVAGFRGDLCETPTDPPPPPPLPHCIHTTGSRDRATCCAVHNPHPAYCQCLC